MSKPSLRDKIKEILTHNAGRIPERLEHDLDAILKAIEDSIGEEFDYGDKLARKALSIEFMGGYNQAIRGVKAKLRGDS